MIKASRSQSYIVDVTIGIPVYKPDLNAFATCLDSVYSQIGFDGNVEILVVVDGEEDNVELLKSGVLDNRPWMTVHIQQHGGECAARNTILKIAKGSWLVFVDADDRLDNRALCNLIGIGRLSNADIVASNHWRVYPNRSERVCRIHDAEVLRGSLCPSFIETILSCGSDQGTVWAKAFRLSYIRDNGLRFNELLVNGVDQEFMVRAVLAAHTIATTPELTYSNIYSAGSVVRSFNSQYPRLLEETMRCIQDDLRDMLHEPAAISSFSEYCLDRFLMLVINYVGHPDFPGGYRARKTAFLRALNAPRYANALKEARFDSFSIARRIVLMCAKARLFFPVWLIALLRHRQLRAG